MLHLIKMWSWLSLIFFFYSKLVIDLMFIDLPRLRHGFRVIPVDIQVVSRFFSSHNKRSVLGAKGTMYLTELQGQLVTYLSSHIKAQKEKIINYSWTSENTWSCWRHRESLVSSIWFLHRWNTRHPLSPKCDQRSKIHELKGGGIGFESQKKSMHISL